MTLIYEKMVVLGVVVVNGEVAYFGDREVSNV